MTAGPVKLPQLLTSTVPAGKLNGNDILQPSRSSPGFGSTPGYKGSTWPLPQVDSEALAKATVASPKTLARSSSKANVDQQLLELVDPYAKGIVRYVDFAWLHVRLLRYGTEPAKLKEKLQSMGGFYPQQVFRKFDADSDSVLDEDEWRLYADSLVDALGKPYVKDACKGLLREQQQLQNQKLAGPLTWRYDDQASRQLLEKVTCSQFLGGREVQVAEALLERLADPNLVDRHGNTVLWHAAPKCEPVFMSRLLAHGGNASLPGLQLDSPALAAARARKLQVLRMLMGLGEEKESVAEALGTKLIDKMAEMVAKDIKDLIQLRANINQRNERGWTPLHAAVFWGRTECVECLTKLPQKIARLHLQVDLQDGNQRTALHLAARKGLPALIPLLLDARASTEAQDGDGWTPLHHAVFNGHSDVVLLLLEASADPKAVDNQGFTPIMMLDSARSSRPLDPKASKALQPPEGVSFARAILPILKNEAATPDEKLQKMLHLNGAHRSFENLRLRDQLFNSRKGPNKVLLSKLWELGRVMLRRLRTEEVDLVASEVEEGDAEDVRQECLHTQRAFLEVWLKETAGPPRSDEWSFENREGYKEELAQCVQDELDRFRDLGEDLRRATLQLPGGEDLESLPEEEVYTQKLSQQQAHEPLHWLASRDVIGAFQALRAVKAFGERSEDDSQALDDFIELVTNDADFTSGPNFWQNVYRLWLAGYAKLLNGSFQSKVHRLVATFNEEHSTEGLQVDYQTCTPATYLGMKAIERSAGFTGPEAAAGLLDIVQCRLIANSPAAIAAMVDCFRNVDTAEVKGGQIELSQLHSSFGCLSTPLENACSVKLNLAYRSVARGLLRSTGIIGQVCLTLPEMVSLRNRAAPLLRHLEREAELLSERQPPRA